MRQLALTLLRIEDGKVTMPSEAVWFLVLLAIILGPCGS